MCLGVEEDRDWKVDPCVPMMNEELLTKLAKLCAGHVKILGHFTKIPYRETVTITAMAQDQGKREELQEVFHQLGLSLHTEDELKKILVVVEVSGRAQVTEEYVLHTQVEVDVLICQAKAIQSSQ